jgi:hypothetical protein
MAAHFVVGPMRSVVRVHSRAPIKELAPELTKHHERMNYT